MKSFVYTEFDAIADTHWWFVARRKILDVVLQKYLKGKTEKKILDVGSASGINVPILLRYTRLVTLLDPHLDSLLVAQKRFPEIQIIPGALPMVLSEKFDVVTAFDVLEHIDNDAETLYSMSNVLEKGGLVFITVPAYGWLWSPHDDAVLHKRRYTEKKLLEKVEKDFNVLYTTYFNTLLFPGIVILRFWYKLFSHKRNATDFDLIPPVLNTSLQWVFALERYFVPFTRFPFGVSILCVAQKK